MDITDVPLDRGWMYLVALLGWYSRYVLGGRLSNRLETALGVAALAEALARQGVPQIHNHDQGAQFTSRDDVQRLQAHGIQISWDGRGRVCDNILGERLRRTVKDEHLYVQEHADGRQPEKGLRQYWRFYNEERPPQALSPRTPAEVCQG